MTRVQMLGERNRLQGVLEAYQAAADPMDTAERHGGLKQRIAELDRKLAEPDRA